MSVFVQMSLRMRVVTVNKLLSFNTNHFGKHCHISALVRGLGQPVHVMAMGKSEEMFPR